MTKKMYFPLVLSLILGLLLLLAPRGEATAAFVCNNSWLAAVDGDWTDAAKWSSGATPVATDDVCITVVGTYKVTLIGSRSVNSVTLGNATTLLIQGGNTGGAATLTSAAGFDNSGTITLETISSTHASNLTLTTGVLANLAGGVFNSNQGTGGPRNFNGNLTNDGTVNLNANTTFNGSTKTYTNNAAFNIATGKTLKVTGGTNTFTQAAETLDIDGGVNWTGTNGVFNLNGGTLDQTGTFSMTGSGGDFNYNGGTIVGNPLINLQSNALTLGALGTSAATFRMRAASTLSGNISAGQTLLIQGGNTGAAATLTSAAGFDNSGTITLETISSTHASNLTLTTGVLANLAGGIFNSNQGTGGPRNFNGSLTNDGTANINANTTFKGSTKTHINNTAFNIATGKTLKVTGGTNTFTQAAGTLDIDGGVNWTATNGIFNLNGGTLDQTCGSFSMTGSGGSFDFAGGAIVGNPVINLQSIALTLGVAGTSAATFRMRASSTFSGNISSGQTLLVQGSDAGGAATLTSAAGFDNSGTVTLETIDGAHAVTLTVTTWTLANLAGGILNVNQGAAGARTFNGSLTNDGTANINTDTTFNGSTRTYANNAAFNIATGKTLNVTGGNNTFNQAAGTLDIDGGLNWTGLTT